MNMKLKGLIASVLAVLCTLTGCASSDEENPVPVQRLNLKAEDSASHSEGDSTFQKVDLKLEKLEQLSIDSGSGTFTVHLAEDGVPYVQMKTRIQGIHIGPKPRLDVAESENSTTISVREGGWISFGSIRKEIDLYLPKDIVRKLDVGIGSGSFYCGGMKLDNLDFQLSSGEAVLDSVSAEEMGLYVSSGNLVLKDAEAGKVEAKLTSGEVVLDTLAAEEMELYVSSGDFVLRSAEARRVEAKVVSGELELEAAGEPVVLKASVSSGDFTFAGGITQGELECTSGEIDVVSATLPEALSCMVSSGEISLGLPEQQGKAEGFSVTCKVSSGNFFNGFPHQDSEGKQVTGKGEREYSFKVTSGSIRLTPIPNTGKGNEP